MRIFKKKEEKNNITENNTASEIVKLYNEHPLHSQEHDDRAYWKAFYDGHHYIKRNPSKKEWEEEEYNHNVHRSKINFIKPNVEIAVSSLLKEQPLPFLMPTGEGHAHELAAKAGSKLLKSMFNDSLRDLGSDIFHAMTNANIYGTGWIYIKWNPNSFAKVGSPENHVESMVGDYEIEVLDDFQVFPDPLPKKFEQLKYIQVVSDMYIEDAKELYPKYKDKICAGVDSEHESTRYQHKYNSYYNSSRPDTVKVINHWERPSAKHKKGRHIVVLNDNITVLDEENPYSEFGHFLSLPVIPFFWDKTAERFHGNSRVKDQIPLQKEINTLASLIMMNAIQNAPLRVGVPKGAMSVEDLSGVIPTLFEYNPLNNAAPVTIGGSSMPGYVLQHLCWLVSTMQDISGVHDISAGQIPERGSRVPASALRIIADSEALRSSKTMHMMKDSIKIVSKFLLLLIRKEYKESRVLNIIGENGKYQLEAFNGSDLNGLWDVAIEIGSVINSSPVAKTEVSFNLWDRGVLQAAAQGDPAAKMLLATLQYGNIEKMAAEDQAHEDRAYWCLEVAKEKGEFPDIYEVDNHEIHIRVLTNFIISKEFLDLPDNIQKIFLQQVDLHKQELSKKQGASQEGQQVPQEPAPADAMAQTDAMSMGAGMTPAIPGLS